VKKNAKFREFLKSVTFLYTFPFWNSLTKICECSIPENRNRRLWPRRQGRVMPMRDLVTVALELRGCQGHVLCRWVFSALYVGSDLGERVECPLKALAISTAIKSGLRRLADSGRPASRPQGSGSGHDAVIIGLRCSR